jgi:hypothetical protein
MGVVAGLVLIGLLAGALVVSIGGAVLGWVPSFVFWLIPVNPNGLAAKLLTGAVLASLAAIALTAWLGRSDEEPGSEALAADRRRRQWTERDADDFAWWMTDGPGRY